MIRRREFLRNCTVGLAGVTLGGVTACTVIKDAMGGKRAADALLRGPISPNIVFVMADDMGYGDAACYDPHYNKVPTPNIDRLADQGMRFTCAHTPSSVCSPTRYGLLTGRYPWRSTLQHDVVGPYGGPIITPGRLTVPMMLKQHGYHTSCIGKWHLGWSWPRDPQTKQVRFDGPIPDGPITRGFDHYFGVDIPNFPPYVFLENDRVTVQPTAWFTGDKEALCPLKGAMAPGWRFDAILPTLVEHAVATIDERAKAGGPFFLYFPLTIPHEPLAPSARFRGKSGISLAADLNMEVDWALGQIMAALEKKGLTGDTLLIFTTDNGHSPTTKLAPFEAVGHRVSGPYRGVKSTVWEGGDRVPFIVRWPGRIKPGSRSDRLICHTDFLATLAELTGTRLPPTAGEDSISYLRLLANPEGAPTRHDVVTASVDGRFAIMQGDWKLILAAGSSGYGAPPTDKQAVDQHLPPVQLYHLAEDIGEQNNLQAWHPEKVRELKTLLVEHIRRGRSTPGPDQANEVEPDIDKPVRMRRF